MKAMGGNGSQTGWAETPPLHVAGSVWEKNIIDLAAAGDVRFVRILKTHVAAKVIRDPRALAVLETEAA